MVLIVFTIPIVELVLAFCLRVLFARQSTTRYLKPLARFGAKLQLCQTPLTFLCISCYLLTPLFIPFDWLWFVFGALMIISSAILLLMPAAKASFPSEDSKEFHDLLVQRRKQGILAVPILLLWGPSWI